MAVIDLSRATHVRAGAFVFFSLAVFVTILITLAGGSDLWRRTTPYIVRFPLETGATGLEIGSDVRIGGRSVGSVARIDLAYDKPGRPPVGVDVTINVERSIPVFPDAVAFLERPLFGSASVINFPSLGGADADAETLEAGGLLRGEIAPPELLRNAGYGSAQSEQLRTIFDRLDEITKSAQAVARDFEQRIFPQFEQAAGDAAAITADARARSAGWFDNTDEILDEFVTISRETNAAVADARAFITEVRGIVDENRPAFNSTVANIERATERADALLARFNDETLNMLNDMLAEGRARVAEAGEIIDRASSLLREEEPEVRVAMANLRLASEELKLTMGEIRRSPWRLLYRPKTRELEYELLYDSARTYAGAVSDLRAASEALESVLASDRPSRPTDGEALETYIRRIGAAFERYRHAEETFLDTLLKQQAP